MPNFQKLTGPDLESDRADRLEASAKLDLSARDAITIYTVLECFKERDKLRQQREWKPMASAPRDKRIVGLFKEEPKVRITKYNSVADCWQNDDPEWVRYFTERPIKWQDLPEET